MKKYLRYADVLVLFTGALGLFLRLIIAMGGTDEKGLYPKNHPAWVILCILSIAVIAAVYLLTRQVPLCLITNIWGMLRFKLMQKMTFGPMNRCSIFPKWHLHTLSTKVVAMVI